MLPLIIPIVVFVTIVLVVFSFGAAVVTPSSVLGARLRALLRIGSDTATLADVAVRTRVVFARFTDART